jgi:hypothetical protein
MEPMIPAELIRLLENFDEVQLQVIAGVAVRVASASSEQYTGKLVISLNANQGVFGDMHVNKGEIVKFVKKRRVLSHGV